MLRKDTKLKPVIICARVERENGAEADEIIESKQMRRNLTGTSL